MLLRTPDSGTTLSANITAGGGSLVYVGADVFTTGSLIAVDDELMGVGAINTTTNTINLFRGALNTTAAAHTAGATIRNVSNLNIRQIVSHQEEVQAGTDIINAWAPGGTIQQAADASNRFMINAWRGDTISKLMRSDVSDEEAALETAKANAITTYGNRFQQQ